MHASLFPYLEAVMFHVGVDIHSTRIAIRAPDQTGQVIHRSQVRGRKGAPVVRQLLAEAAWQAVPQSPTVRAFYERTRRDDPQRQKIARVATAHYPVRVMWAMLRRGTAWEEPHARVA